MSRADEGDATMSMAGLERFVREVPDFPQPGILFRDISPLLRHHLEATIEAMEALWTEAEWGEVDALAGIESRGFILGSALALKRRKGFVLVRKQGKLPPPVVDVAYDLEYGSSVLEMQRGSGRLLLIDDVLATGGTMMASADLCLRAGYEVRGLGVLVDLKLLSGYRWRDFPVRTVISY